MKQDLKQDLKRLAFYLAVFFVAGWMVTSCADNMQRNLCCWV